MSRSVALLSVASIQIVLGHSSASKKITSFAKVNSASFVDFGPELHIAGNDGQFDTPNLTACDDKPHQILFVLSYPSDSWLHDRVILIRISILIATTISIGIVQGLQL